ncbi:hypothetical protein [Pseudomonas sp. AB12(2023)]|uniref:hypothetical protein n=1 Tax=Pseudomonas sp. AB12(2023) TaxID=3048597 RepID=UPI002B239CDD|nr:hypothetical protein [Pseudomonas sp. AB12(2023)]MEB0222063.1 hypothetical protein [Pseudomonas sp. AB12(2023)]
MIVDNGLDGNSCLHHLKARRLILVEEIRNERMAFEVVALAQGGAKVVATMQGKPGFDRLRQLLRQFGVGEVFLEGLMTDGQIISIHQKLVRADIDTQHQSAQDRNELILRQHGFGDIEVDSLVKKGPQAVLNALLHKNLSKDNLG